MEMHLAAMRADGDPIPEPTTRTAYVEMTGYAPATRRR